MQASMSASIRKIAIFYINTSLNWDLNVSNHRVHSTSSRKYRMVMIRLSANLQKNITSCWFQVLPLPEKDISASPTVSARNRFCARCLPLKNLQKKSFILNKKIRPLKSGRIFFISLLIVFKSIHEYQCIPS